MAAPETAPTDDKPAGITCEQYVRGEGKRCRHYLPNGACSLPGELMCVEWLKKNGQRPPPPAKDPVFETIYFDSNKSNISPTAAKALDQNGMLLKDNPRIKVEIAGHSDSGGSAVANESISVKRAESAKKYIQDKYNIPADRMVIKGYGDSKPIADNKTQEGRAKNRRSEFMIIK